MTNLINHILVPVNYNRNTDFVLQKSVAIANAFDADLHILHVETPLISLPFVYEGIYISANHEPDSGKQVATKMKGLLEKYRPKMKEGLQLNGTVMKGNWFSMMKETVITNHIDLIVIPRNSKRFFGALLYEVNLNRLSQQSQCPILTVTPELEIDHLKNIVVPVDDFLPIRKLTLATYLARKFNAKVHLTGAGSNADGKDLTNSIFLAKSYQLLTKYAEVQIHYPSDNTNTLAADSLAYAKSVNADLIVVNPGKESKLGKWFSSLLGKYLYKESNIPVLTVSPKQ